MLPTNIELLLATDLASAWKQADHFSWSAAPKFWRNLFFKYHKSYDERRRVWLLLWRNGLSPEEAAFWTLWHGIRGINRVPPRYAHDLGYDRAAHYAMRDLVRRAGRDASYFDKYRVWSFLSGRVE